MSDTTRSICARWADRFSVVINGFARVGPYSKLAKGLFKDEIEEAMADITWQTKCAVYNRQVECTHLKGGRTRSRYASRDYAVTKHTFIDSRTRIKCVLCGLEAWSNSGEDFKFAYMQSLADDSTNCPSASEQVLLQVKRGKAVLATFPNTDSGRAELRKAYPNWNGEIQQPEYDPPKEDDGLKIPEDHSPIKGMHASTPEAGPDSPSAIIVAFHDDLLYREQK